MAHSTVQDFHEIANQHRKAIGEVADDKTMKPSIYDALSEEQKAAINADVKEIEQFGWDGRIGIAQQALGVIAEHNSSGDYEKDYLYLKGLAEIISKKIRRR